MTFLVSQDILLERDHGFFTHEPFYRHVLLPGFRLME